MDQMHSELIEKAQAVCGGFTLREREGFSAGGVGAAIRMSSGSVYTGICIDLASGLGFCAEVSAIAEALKNRETQIVMAVAVSGDRILPPCGRCREMMVQIDGRNMDARIIIAQERHVALRELMPEHWLDARCR